MHIETLDYPLIQIPAGMFIMGTIPTGMRKTDPEEPQRSVLLDGYAIGTYQVTNAQYAQFVEETGHPQPLFWNEVASQRSRFSCRWGELAGCDSFFGVAQRA